MINEKITCPKCGGGSHTKKGKTKNKQFQRLQCKKCLKQFQIEVRIFDKQMKLPTIETRIIKYPNGGFSVCSIKYYDINVPNNRIECVEIFTPKVKTYRDIIKYIRTHDIEIDRPGPVEIDRHVPESVVKSLKYLFGDMSQVWVNVIDKMAS